MKDRPFCTITALLDADNSNTVFKKFRLDKHRLILASLKMTPLQSENSCTEFTFYEEIPKDEPLTTDQQVKEQIIDAIKNLNILIDNATKKGLDVDIDIPNEAAYSFNPVKHVVLKRIVKVI